MPFGGSTIQLVTITEDTSAPPDELGNYPLVKVVTNLPGCRHRTLSLKETAELEFDISTVGWKSTIPVVEYSSSLQSKVLNLKGNDVIRVDGNEYQIIGGVRNHPDMDGRPFKATIISERKVG